MKVIQINRPHPAIARDARIPLLMTALKFSLAEQAWLPGDLGFIAQRHYEQTTPDHNHGVISGGQNWGGY